MPSRQLHLLLWATLLLTGSCLRAEESTAEKAWKAILENRFEAPATKGNDQAGLDAAYFAAKARGDYTTALLALERELLRAPASPDALLTLKRLLFLSARSPEQARLAQVFTQLLPRKDCLPALRLKLRQALIGRRLRERNGPALAKLVKGDGSIRLWARLAGPFQDERPFQVDRINGFLLNPGADALPEDSGAKAKLLTDVSTAHRGTVNLGDHLPRASEGAACAIALLRSDQERKAILSLPSLGSARAWLNGEPVYRSDLYQGYRRPRRFLQVQLKQGLNLLILKTRSSITLSAALLSTDYHALPGVTVVPWNEGKNQVNGIRTLHGFLASTDLPSPYLPQAQPEDEPVYRALRRGEGLEAAGRIQPARALYLELAERYPKSSLLQVEAGLFLFRESGLGIDSRERLQKEGLALLEKALTLSPQSPRAHFMTAYYLNSHGEKDRALQSLSAALKAAPQWEHAATELAAYRTRRGQQALAESLLRGVQEKSPQARLQLFRLLERTSRYQEADLQMAALWQNHEIDAASRFRYLLKRKQFDAIEALLQEEAELFGDDTNAKHRIASWRSRLHTERGELSPALAVLQERTQWQPWNPALYEEAAELFLRDGKRKQALQSLQRMQSLQLEEESLDAALVKRIESLGGTPWIHPSFDLSRSPQGEADFTPKRFPASHHANLVQVVVCRVYPDRSSVSLTHNAIKLFDKQGIQNLGELRLPSNPDDLLFCRTVQPDGTVYTPTNIRKLNFTSTASLARLAPGCIVEYAFRRSRGGGRSRNFNDHFWFEEFNTPTAQARYVLILPTEMENQLSLRSWPSTLAPTRTVKNDLVIYTWDSSTLEVTRPEPNMPPARLVLKNVEARLRAPMTGDQDYRLRRPRPLHTHAAIAKYALELTADCTTDRERVLELHRAVRDRLKPVDGARTPRDAFALKSGTPAVAVDLLTAMLDSLGIRSSRAQANRNLMQHVSAAEDRAQTLRSFSTPLLKVHLKQDLPLWLSFGRPARNYRAGDIGSGLRQSPAILRDRLGHLTLDWVEGHRSERRSWAMNRNIALKADGSATINATMALYGRQA
ncbi:MAG: DUF3857 domain-containing protein, partial [Planctomycetota bacterium]